MQMMRGSSSLDGAAAAKDASEVKKPRIMEDFILIVWVEEKLELLRKRVKSSVLNIEVA